MSEFLDDVKKYDSNPDEAAVKKIASNLRLVMIKADARLVSTTDPEEVARVVKNFGVKKLGVSEAEAEVAVKAVAEQMKGERNKSRVTFYYLVAKKLNKLSAV